MRSKGVRLLAVTLTISDAIQTVKVTAQEPLQPRAMQFESKQSPTKRRSNSKTTIAVVLKDEAGN